MDYRDARLRDFFRGWFHEDWDMHGAETWQDVVAQYVAQTPQRDALRTQADLRSWLQDTAKDSTPEQELPAAFGCDYDPRPDGMDERAWAAAIADLLEKLAGGA